MFKSPAAIIDIGSNSVRLVVYGGSRRIPSIVFNEKVMAGLGKGVADSGRLADEPQERALAALRRFRILTRQMGVGLTRVVATAAVRDAENGESFLAKVRETGFEPEMLGGKEEGVMAGLGVLSGIPGADGVAGDLGGGSLELVNVSGGKPSKSRSLPLGVLRIGAAYRKGEAALAKLVAKAVDGDLRKLGRGRPFYLVGGSWRAVARLDMHLSNYPLPIIHQYRMRPDRPAALQKKLDGIGKDDVREISAFTSSRVPMLPRANMLLKLLVDLLEPSELIVSSFGIREGLLYDELSARERARDPLIEATREAGIGMGRFAPHGDLLDRWIAPVFDDPPELARLRLAACLLADVAWQAHPDFRAERGVDMALHGNWVGVDGPGRVMIAQALFCNFGGSGSFSENGVSRLCSADQLRRAGQWGLAMRLGQRLSGGVAASLERSRLALAPGVIRLELPKGEEALFGEAVERRLNTLAAAIGRQAVATA